MLKMFHSPHSNDTASENKINNDFRQDSAPPHIVFRSAMNYMLQFLTDASEEVAFQTVQNCTCEKHYLH